MTTPVCRGHMSETPSAEPTTDAGRALLEREAYNSRSFALITAEAIVAIEREIAARSQPATEGLDVDTLQYALEAVDPAAFPVRGTVALDHENVDHFRYAHAVAREYAALAGTEPAGDER